MKKKDIDMNIPQKSSTTNHMEQNKLLAEALEMSQIQVQELSLQLKQSKMEILKYKLQLIKQQCTNSTTLEIPDNINRQIVKLEFDKISNAVSKLQEILLQPTENNLTTHDDDRNHIIDLGNNSIDHSLSILKNIVSNISVIDTEIDTVPGNKISRDDIETCDTTTPNESFNKSIIPTSLYSNNQSINEQINSTFEVDTIHQDPNHSIYGSHSDPKDFKTDKIKCDDNFITEAITNNPLLDTPTPSVKTSPNMRPRPRRNAASKISSYKEPSIRYKLRRGDQHTDNFLVENPDPNFIYKIKSKKSSRHNSLINNNSSRNNPGKTKITTNR